MNLSELTILLKLPKVWNRYQVNQNTDLNIGRNEWIKYVYLRKKHGAELNDWPNSSIKILTGLDAPRDPKPPSSAGISPDHLSYPSEENTSTDPGNTGAKPGEGQQFPKFEDLTEEDIQYLREIHQNTKSELDKFLEIRNKFGIEMRTGKLWMSKLGITRNNEVPDVLKKAQGREFVGKKYQIITSAQSATPIHDGLWENIQVYAGELGAEIRVVPYRYKNPTSRHTDLSDDWWSPKVIPYLDLNKHLICPNLWLLGNLKIQPTAEYPLNDLHAITMGKSAIIGHPKVQMRPCAVLEKQHKQILYTTGSLTVENYTDSRAGAKGESFHTYGFVIVEIDGDDFHVRQVVACDDGSFQDLIYSVSEGEVERVDACRNYVLGDYHTGDTDLSKIQASINMWNHLVPENIILHDLFNGHSINPHESQNAILKYQSIVKGRHLLEVEVKEMLDTLHWLTQESPKSKFVVVASNHDDFASRYIRDYNWKHDAANAPYYAKCLSVLLQDFDGKGLIPHLIEEEFGSQILTLGRDDSFKPGEYELAYHGDQGSSGSRGSILQYCKMPTKCIVGHYHAPWRINGALSVGTSTHLKLDYTKGPSAWNHADIIEHLNGKSQHLIFNEKYRCTTFFD